MFTARYALSPYITHVRLVLNPLNAELNPICHLLALLEAHHILHVSKVRVKGLNITGFILANNQLDAQFFMCVYFYSLHVSGSHVPIIRRIIVSMRRLIYVALCR